MALNTNEHQSGAAALAAVPSHRGPSPHSADAVTERSARRRVRETQQTRRSAQHTRCCPRSPGRPFAVSVPSCLAAEPQPCPDATHTPVWQGVIQVFLTPYVPRLQKLRVSFILYITKKWNLSCLHPSQITAADCIAAVLLNIPAQGNTHPRKAQLYCAALDCFLADIANREHVWHRCTYSCSVCNGHHQATTTTVRTEGAVSWYPWGNPPGLVFLRGHCFLSGLIQPDSSLLPFFFFFHSATELLYTIVHSHFLVYEHRMLEGCLP